MPRDTPYLVFGTDGSDRSQAARDWTADFAAERRWSVRIVHALDDSLRRTPYFSTETVDAAARRVAARARSAIVQRTANVDVTSHVVIGSPVDALLDAGADARAIVIGRRGGGSSTRMLIGSTPEALATRARVPIVVVPEGWDARTAGPVAVGIDGSARCESALAFAFDVAQRSGSGLRVVHVWELPQMYGSADEPEQGRRLERGASDARLTIAEATEAWRHKLPEVDVEDRAVRGHPVDALVDSARDARLLVVGGRGNGRYAGPLLGSIARGVLHHAQAPVAVVHNPG